MYKSFDDDAKQQNSWLQRANNRMLCFLGDAIGVYVVSSFNYAFKTGNLSISQRQGIISLIPKKKDTPFLKNWRPVSQHLTTSPAVF